MRVVGKRRRIPPRGAAIAVAVSGIVLLLAVFFLRSVESPTHQFRVVIGSTGEHLINVWLDPDPPVVGPIVVTAQATDTGGNPQASSMVIFLASPQSGGPLIQEEGIPVEVQSRTDVGKFRTTLELPEPGDWTLDVKVVMGGEGVSVEIPMEVTAVD